MPNNYQNTLLICGGIYGNWQALTALLAEATRRTIAHDHIIITGDLAAYCADGEAVATFCRQQLPATLIVRGNCERALATNADNCGCGFSANSTCDLLSAAWYRYARDNISAANKQWMATLPVHAEIDFAGRRLAVLHGGCDADNTFIFASTPDKEKHIQALQCNGVIAGHCGIPFSQSVGGALWHNSGALGMPANDGSSNVWYSVWHDTAAGIEIEHCPLAYDHPTAAAAMTAAGLPPPYRQTLANGIWPSDSVLPTAEKKQQGTVLSARHFLWQKNGTLIEKNNTPRR